MMVRECLELSEHILVEFAAILTNTAQQSLPRCAEGPIDPAGVSFAWVSLPALEDPLQRIIHDPPIAVELPYKRI